EEQDVAPAAQAAAIGGRLKAAREAKELSLADVSSDLRISKRHLEMIEDDDFVSLPARTYAIGFTRSYARMLGLDEHAAVDEVRAILDDASEDTFRRTPINTFEPGDPARVPTSAVGWVSAAAVILLLIGGFIFYRGFLSPAETLPPLTEPQAEAPAAAPTTASAPAPSAAATGPVVFTAQDDGIWVKFYDADGRQLMQKQMAKGESYTVPADAKGPQVWTGRPDALAITVGGRPVPPLSNQEKVVKDIPVSAEALLARPAAPSAGEASPSAPAAPTSPTAAPAT
ncbi:MAG: helix-turn-helix domain-containing protein, partial [Novosphingobium sp.]